MPIQKINARESGSLPGTHKFGSHKKEMVQPRFGSHKKEMVQPRFGSHKKEMVEPPQQAYASDKYMTEG